MFIFLRRSQTGPSLIEEGMLLPQFSPSDPLGEPLPVKSEAKKVIEYLSLLLVCSQPPALMDVC